MVKQNVNNLTIKQIKNLLENNGLAANGNEYCLVALKASLHDKQSKAADMYINSEKAHIALCNAYSKHIEPVESNVLPPKLNKIKKTIEKLSFKFTLKHSINEENSLNLRKFKFLILN